jgi:hypothetical protein
MLRRSIPYWNTSKRGGGIPFDPISLGNLEVWYDASDDSTITRLGTMSAESTTLDLVSQMNDKSGNGRNLVQATESARPAVSSFTQNGLQTIVDPGSGARFLQTSGSFTLSGYPVTIYVVARHQTTGASCLASYAQPSVNNRRINFNSLTTTSANFQVRSATASTAGITSNITVVANTWYVYEGKAISSTLRECAIDGGSYSNNTETIAYTSSTHFFLLRSSNVNPIGTNTQLFGECLMYSSEHDSTERDQVINYLKSKWGI